MTTLNLTHNRPAAYSTVVVDVHTIKGILLDAIGDGYSTVILSQAHAIAFDKYYKGMPINVGYVDKGHIVYTNTLEQPAYTQSQHSLFVFNEHNKALNALD